MSTNRLLILTIISIVLIVVLGCSNDKNATGSSGGLTTKKVQGEWLWVAVEVNGQPGQSFSHTLKFHADMSGIYRTQLGFGWYDFEYRYWLGRIIVTHTAGQTAGLVDTFGYAILGDTLVLVRDSSDIHPTTSTFRYIELP